MNKLIKNIMLIIISICIVYSIFTISFQKSTLENIDFYLNRYEVQGSDSELELSKEDARIVTVSMIEYMTGQRDDMQVEATVLGETRNFFTEREISHFLDVRNIMMPIIQIKNTALVIISVLLAVIIGLCVVIKEKYNLKEILANYCKIQMIVIGTAVIIFILLGIVCAIDFNSIFLLFHELSFDNDNWLLNPIYDKVIVLMPTSFFIAALTNILVWFAIGLVTWFIGCIVVRKLVIRR